jgi:hypothetical protein
MLGNFQIAGATRNQLSQKMINQTKGNPMKKLLFAICMLLASFTANAYQTYSAAGTSDTVIVVNPATGKPVLQQDTINSLNSGQPTRTFGYVFGRNSAVNNVRCDLWDGPTCTYVFPTAAQQMTIVSSSASDTLAGTGAQKVMIHYLDNNYNMQAETISLNGTTPVNTVATNILRINAFHIYQLGSGGASVGNISVKNLAGAVTYSYVQLGYDAARQAIYTVPSGMVGYINHWQASSGTASGSHFTRIALRATAHEGNLLPGVFRAIDEVGTLNNGMEITLPIPIRIPAMADVKMTAISDSASANAITMGAIMGWFETQ